MLGVFPDLVSTTRTHTRIHLSCHNYPCRSINNHSTEQYTIQTIRTHKFSRLWYNQYTAVNEKNLLFGWTQVDKLKIYIFAIRIISEILLNYIINFKISNRVSNRGTLWNNILCFENSKKPAVCLHRKCNEANGGRRATRKRTTKNGSKLGTSQSGSPIKNRPLTTF